MRSSPEGSTLVSIPPGIIGVFNFIPNPQRESADPSTITQSKPATSWIASPGVAVNVHVSLEAQERTIARLAQVEPTSSPWETARDQATQPPKRSI